MIYPVYSIGGELYHSNTATGKAFKYIDKVRTKSGKWRYIYQKYQENKRNEIVNKKRKMVEEADRDGAFVNTPNLHLTKRQEEKMRRVKYAMVNSKLSDKELNERIDRVSKGHYSGGGTGDRVVEAGVEKKKYYLEKERKKRRDGVTLGRQR